MVNEGLSVSDIALQYGCTESTVAANLSEFVLSGELSVARVVPQKKIELLTPWVLDAIARDELYLTPIREAVGEQFSYADIRFVMNHCLYLRK
jgi:hypothetical protein